jgi:hypothetical protein
MFDRYDPRWGDDPRDRDVERPDISRGSRAGGDPREPHRRVDPREVFTEQLRLPRGDARERVDMPERAYDLRARVACWPRSARSASCRRATCATARTVPPTGHETPSCCSSRRGRVISRDRSRARVAVAFHMPVTTDADPIASDVAGPFEVLTWIRSADIS